MFVRLATEADESAILELGRAATAESFPEWTYDEERALETIRFNFVLLAYDADGPAGFSLCAVGDLPFAVGNFVEQRVIYVRPEKRGTRAAVHLIRAFVAWVESFQPTAAQVSLGSGRRTEAVSRLVRRHGFEVIGHTLRKTTHGRHIQ